MGRWKQLARILLVMAMSEERVVFSLHVFQSFVNNPIELGCESASMVGQRVTIEPDIVQYVSFPVRPVMAAGEGIPIVVNAPIL
jgi:hypothetical protein